MAAKSQILVVEDDPLVSDIIVAVLDQTYPVTVAENASAALDVLREGTVRLVLLDCTLPGGIPPDLLTKADGDSVPVILMSGDPDRVKRVSDTPRPFLRKPFTVAGLMDTIESALASGEGQTPG